MAPFNKYIIYFGQSVFQAAFAFAQQLLRFIKAGFSQGSTVHFPRTPRQVVRFVHQEDIIPGRFKKSHQMYNRIKQIIVIPNNHIAPQAAVQPQLKGAYRVAFCIFLQGFRRQAGDIQHIPESAFDAGIIPVGIGAGFRGTLPRLTQADLVFRCQRYTAQVQFRLGIAQDSQCVFRCCTGCAAGR